MKLKVGAFLGAFLFFLSMMAMPVRGAARIILDMEYEHNVGDKVEIIVRCIDSDGDVVAGNIKFQYKTTEFEFVSCSVEGATPENGVLTTYGRNVTIVLIPIAEGNPYVRADQLDDNGSSIHAAGVTLEIGPGEYVPDEGTNEDEGNTGDEGEDEGNSGNEGGSENEGNSGNEGNGGNSGNEDNRLQNVYLYINNQMFYVTSEHWNELIELGFTPQEVLVNNLVTTGLKYEETSIVLLHLVNANTGKDAGYFVYDTETQAICPYVSYGTAGNEEVEDELESIQENYQKLFNKYEEIKHKNRNMLTGIILTIVVVVIVIISLLVYKRRRDEEEFEMDYKRTDGGAPLKKQGEYLDAIAKNSYKEDEGLPKDAFMAEEESKKHVGASSGNEMDTDDVEVIDLEDL